jgi:uncharacterized membrane protein YphA (DoxX/SURF4 family)
MKINQDVSDFLFRLLFSTIFVGLGMEHIFSDELIRQLMPTWVPHPRLISFLCGLWLVAWGGLIVIGWRLRLAALALGAFLVVVTFAVHAPGILGHPSSMNLECTWMWDILQRSNLVKNVCLLGVCFHLLYHDVGKYSFEEYLKLKKK